MAPSVVFTTRRAFDLLDTILSCEAQMAIDLMDVMGVPRLGRGTRRRLRRRAGGLGAAAGGHATGRRGRQHPRRPALGVRRAARLAVVALAPIVPVAAAHGGASNRYRSTVTGIAPATRGITAVVLERDHELQLTNATGALVIVLGYEREPYLRLHPGGGPGTDPCNGTYALADHQRREP